MPLPRRIPVRVARVCLVVSAPILLLAVTEVGLRTFGFGRQTDFFIPDEVPGMYRSNPRFTDTFFPASFGLKPLNFRLPREKPANTARVFVLGESAAMGVPEPGFGVAPQLQALLRAAYPAKHVEVYNLGITAINSHVIRLIARDAATFSPDAFVIYMGNNEVVGPYGPGSAITATMLPLRWIRASAWVRETRIGQLMERVAQAWHRGGAFRDWRGMVLFAGQTVAADDPRLAAVYANFAANLGDILHAAKSVGAKVVLSTVATDYADCAPFVSLHRAGMSDAQLAAWRRAEERGIVASELERWTDAQASFEDALRIDPNYAETEFRLARALQARGKVAAARRHFAGALQRDALRFRADARINQIVREAARTGGPDVVLVDAADALGATETSSAPISSHREFFEHVHFKWDGNYALARLLAPAVVAALFGSGSHSWLSPDACAQRTGYTPIGRQQMLMRMDELTARPPFTSQFTFAADRTALRGQIEAGIADTKDPARQASAVAAVEKALAQDPDNAFLAFHAAAANSESGNLQRALDLNGRVAALQPPSAEDAAQRAFLLRLAHRDREAETVLLASADAEPYYFQTYTLLGQLWADTDTAKGRDYFAKLVPRMPDSAAVRLAYADLLVKAGAWNEAEDQWRAVLRRTPDNEAALTALAQRLVATGRRDDAVQLMLDAYAYNPRSFPNDERLLQYYAQQGKRDKIVEFMQALAASGPVTGELHADLADLLLQAGRRTDALVEFTKAEREARAGGDADLARQAADAIRENGLSWEP